jgi:hypothetical protein
LIKQLNKEDVKGISSIENAIPGTYPTFIIQYKDLMGKIDSKNWWSKLKSENRIDWNTQRQNNNQFNLNRPLRVKIFLELFKKIDQMSACVILENYNDWFSYYKETTPTQESKAVVEIFNEIHGDSKMFNKLENTLSKKIKVQKL